VSSIQNRNPWIGLLSIIAVWKQFKGYGSGFLLSQYRIHWLKKNPQEAFPELFFTTKEARLTEEIHIHKEAEEPIHKSVEKALDKFIAPLQKIVDTTPVKTKIIGLTGGIGSGKTTIANYIKSLGIPVYIADNEAKKLLNDDTIQKEIKSAFGETIFENNLLSKERLSQIVFNDRDKLKKLNGIIHPAVKAHFKEWLEDYKKVPMVVKEAAILFESGSDQDCDAVITVVAPINTRIERVENRDNISKEEVLNRIKNQWTDEMRLEKSDYSIENNDLTKAFQQVDEILKKIVNH
jgi:dephospho-CoA kinase